MPQAFEQAGLPDFDGVVWFRYRFELPASWAGHTLKLGLGPVDDVDTTFVNGTKVGQMNRYDLNRVYSVPAEVLKPGTNVISVRVLDTGGNGGLVGTPDQLFLQRRGQLAALALRHRLPAVYPIRDFPEAGGLMSYGSSFADAHRLAGVYAGRILKGDKPADMPVIQGAKFDFVINLKTAKAIGIEIHPQLLATADEVIE